MTRKVSLLIILALGALVGRGGPVALGPNAIAEKQWVLVDEGRNRRVEVLLLYPVGIKDSPWVAFSPGFLFTGPAYRSWAEILASHGIATALLSYAYSLFNPDHRALAADLLFVLANLPNEAALHGVLLDHENVGLIGHSLGGKLSILAAAERAVRAVVGLDPVDGGPPGMIDPVRFPSAIARMAHVKAPVLLLGAEYGERIRFGVPCAPPELNFRRLFAAAAGPCWEVTQLGGGHLDYLDDPNCGLLCSVCWPGEDPDRARSWAQTYALLFLRGYLFGDAEALLRLHSLLVQHEKDGLVRFRLKHDNPGL